MIFQVPPITYFMAVANNDTAQRGQKGKVRGALTCDPHMRSGGFWRLLRTTHSGTRLLTRGRAASPWQRGQATPSAHPCTAFRARDVKVARLLPGSSSGTRLPVASPAAHSTRGPVRTTQGDRDPPRGNHHQLLYIWTPSCSTSTYVLRRIRYNN